MNRFLVIIIIVLCLSKIGYSQYGKFTVGFATGPDIPVGNFANHNLNSQYGGFAKPGLNINGSFGYRLSRYAGVGLMVTSTNNPLNSLAYATQYTAQQGIPVKGTSGSWKATSAFFGIFYSIPVKRFFFDIRLYRGFMVCTSAQIKLQSYDNQYSITQKPGTGVSSYAYDFGTSVKYAVGESKRVFLAANIDFMMAQVNFSDVQIVSTSLGSPPGYQSTSFSQPYSNLSVSFGVGVILGKMIY